MHQIRVSICLLFGLLAFSCGNETITRFATEKTTSDSVAITADAWIEHPIDIAEPSQLTGTLNWNNASCNLNLFLYDPGGTLIAFQNSTTNKPEIVSVEATEIGTWRFGIKNKSGAVTDYQLTIDSEPLETGGGQCGNGEIETGEECDGGPCCTAACAFVAAGTICRAASGLCDQAETCSGSSADCPADELLPSGTTCRAAAGECDAAEYCNGIETACPADESVPDGTDCTNGTCEDGTCQAPVNTGMLLGGSGWQASDIFDWEADMGQTLQIVRRYDSGCPATMAASGSFSQFLDGTRALHASVKCGTSPNLTALRTLVESIPDNVECYFTAEHEPENPAKNIDAAAWGQMQHDLKAIIDEVNTSRNARGAIPITHVAVLMGWTIDTQNNNRDNEGMPFLNAIADLAGTGTEVDVDPYDWSTPKGQSPEEFSEFTATIYTVLEDYGFPWGVAETGTQARSDADTARWLRDAVEWAASVGCRRFEYFNIDARQMGEVNNWLLGPLAVQEFGELLAE